MFRTLEVCHPVPPPTAERTLTTYPGLWSPGLYILENSHLSPTPFSQCPFPRMLSPTSEDSAQEDTFLFVIFQKIPHRSQHLRALGLRAALEWGSGSPGNRFFVTWPGRPGRTAVVPVVALPKSQTRLSAETVTGAGRGRGLQQKSCAVRRCRGAAVAAHKCGAPRSVQNYLPSASLFDSAGNGGSHRRVPLPALFRRRGLWC